MTNTRYLSCAETAKLIRKALKLAFPRVKFSVRSKTYSGGASISVGWIDGPTTQQVDRVVGVYGGGGFDGMIDLAYSKYAWLMPDGSATFAKTGGTEGSMGSVPSHQEMQPSAKAELVRFGADYVFTRRDYSSGFFRRAFERVCRYRNQNPSDFAIKDSLVGPYIDPCTDRDIDGHLMSHLVNRELQQRVGVEGQS